MRRTLAVIGPAVARGVPVVGLEPSCLLTFRDEMPGLLGDEWTPEQGRQVMLLEEFIAARLEPAGGGFALPLAPLRQKSALLHGHRSEEHTSELQSLMRISSAVFCLKKKKHDEHNHITNKMLYMN